MAANMLGPRIALVGVGRPGFDIELGSKHYLDAIKMLEGLCAEVRYPLQLLTDPSQVAEWIRSSADPGADGVVLMLATFVDGRFVAELARGLRQPILLWSLPEPGNHGRLRLNSLTGLNSASYVLSHLGRNFAYLYDRPGDTPPKQLLAWLKAAAAAGCLRTAKIAVVGSPPPGFYASDVDPLRLQRTIGPSLVQINLDTLLQQSAEVSEQRWRAHLDSDRASVSGLERLDPDQLRKSSQFNLALDDVVRSLGFQAVAVRCWPEILQPIRRRRLLLPVAPERRRDPCRL